MCVGGVVSGFRAAAGWCVAGAGHLRQSPNVGLQGCVRRSFSALCNKPANASWSREGCSPALTHSLPLKSQQEREKEKKERERSAFSCYSLLPPSSVGVEGGRGGQLQCQIEGPMDLIRSFPHFSAGRGFICH